MKKIMYLLLAAMAVSFGSCKENYSQGEKVGNLIEFTKKGVVGLLGGEHEPYADGYEHERRAFLFQFR